MSPAVAVAALTVPAQYAESFRQAAREAHCEVAEAFAGLMKGRVGFISLTDAEYEEQCRAQRDDERGCLLRLAQIEELRSSLEDHGDGDLAVDCNEGLCQVVSNAIVNGGRLLEGTDDVQGPEMRGTLREAMAELEWWLTLSKAVEDAVPEAVAV